MSATTVTDTKEAILDAAEAIFAEVGFEKASIRQIVAAADVNLAAVHYHFGSKEALVEAVFTRCVGPVNAERLELLHAIESAHPAGPLPLEALLEAFLAPMIRHARAEAPRRAKMTRLYGRLVAEPSDALEHMMKRQFGGVVKRFAAAFHRAIPEVPEPELMWRIFFTVGAAAHLLLDPPGFKKVSHGMCDPADVDAALEHLVRFAAAGLRAPAATLKETRR